MGGVSAIQQLVFNDVFKIGLTEHVSRNGRESVWNESDCGRFDVLFKKKIGLR